MPNARTKNLIKETTWFAIGNFGSKILSLLLVPFYTNILSTGEYGTADIISTTVSLVIPVLTLSLQDAAFRFALDNQVDKNCVITDCLSVTILSPIVLLLFFPLLHVALPALAEYGWYFWGIFTFNSISSVLSCYLKGIGKSSIYAIQGILYTFVCAACNIIFLGIIRIGIKGYLLSILIAHVLSCVFMYFAADVRKQISVSNFNFKLLKDMLKFSIPLIPASAAWWIMSSIDRYMLLYMCGTDANGLYSVAHKLPTVVSVLTTFFINAWQITAVRSKDDSDICEYTSKIFENFMAIGLGISFAMILFSQLLGKLFFAKEFYQAWTMVPLLTVSTIFSALSLFIGAQFTTSKRSDLHLKSNIIAMASNIILNYILIKKLGINGAAYGTMFSYFIVLVYRQVKVQELLPLRINKGKIYLVSILLMSAATIISSKLPWQYLITLVFFAFSLILYRKNVFEMTSSIITLFKTFFWRNRNHA